MQIIVGGIGEAFANPNAKLSPGCWAILILYDHKQITTVSTKDNTSCPQSRERNPSGTRESEQNF